MLLIDSEYNILPMADQIMNKDLSKLENTSTFTKFTKRQLCIAEENSESVETVRIEENVFVKYAFEDGSILCLLIKIN